MGYWGIDILGHWYTGILVQLSKSFLYFVVQTLIVKKDTVPGDLSLGLSPKARRKQVLLLHLLYIIYNVIFSWVVLVVLVEEVVQEVVKDLKVLENLEEKVHLN